MSIKDWLFGKKESPPAVEESATQPSSPQPEPSGDSSSNPSESAGGQWFQRLTHAVSQTGRAFFGSLESEWEGKGDRPLTDDDLETLEETLLRADVGIATTTEIMDRVEAQRKSITSLEQLLAFLRQEFKTILCPAGESEGAHGLHFNPNGLNIYLVVGVNGAGKTTLIGKLAHRFVEQGEKVLIGAGDTFRAAADDQLAIWAERSKATLIRKPHGTDPGAVIHDTLAQATEAGASVVILDTAGRLQNKFNLMEELKKIHRIIEKAMDADPRPAHLESLLVVDATTGQNALQQASVFKEAVNLNGVALTKLDGSAKGGVILAITQEHGLPVKLVGVGEKVTDLQDFDPTAFVEALFQGRLTETDAGAPAPV